MIKGDNFYVIFYWMINELGLKGAELPVFAIIYSFSQDNKSYFNGSLNYIAEFTGLTKRGVIKVIQRLVDRKYVIKEQWTENGITYNRYKINYKVVNDVHRGGELRSPGVVNESAKGGERRSPNNKEIINNDNKDIKDIVDYLNEKAGTKYRVGKDTKRHITARLNEGYTVDDFKTVIDKKVDEWLGDAKMAQYLRPSTLFGTKFDTYLNQPVKKQSNGGYDY